VAGVVETLEPRMLVVVVEQVDLEPELDYPCLLPAVMAMAITPLLLAVEGLRIIVEMIPFFLLLHLPKAAMVVEQAEQTEQTEVAGVAAGQILV